MFKVLFQLIFAIRNIVTKLATKAINKIRDPYTGKLTILAPDQIKPTLKFVFFVLFTGILIYSMLTIK